MAPHAPMSDEYQPGQPVHPGMPGGAVIPFSSPFGTPVGTSIGDGRRVAQPRGQRPATETPTRVPIQLRDHSVWPIPMFADDSTYGHCDSRGRLFADSDLCLKIGVTDGTRSEWFSANEPFPPDMTFDALLRRWGSPTDKIGYEIQLFVRSEAEGSTRGPRHYVCSRRIYERHLTEDQKNELGDEPWPINSGDNTPRIILDEIDQRERERVEERVRAEHGFPSNDRPSQYGQPGQSGQSGQPSQMANPFAAPSDPSNPWGQTIAPLLPNAPPVPPPFSPDPGKKWTYWNGAWLQVADGNADAPPPYPPAPGLVWAKLNGSWQQIQDPSAPKRSGVLSELLDAMKSNPEISAVVTGVVGTALKRWLDPPAPTPAPAPAVDIEARLAAQRAELQAQFADRDRQAAQADRDRLQAELTQARRERDNAQPREAPRSDPASEVAKFIEQTRKNAKLLGMSEQTVDKAAEGADTTKDFILNLADTPAGVKAAEILTNGFAAWLAKAPPAAMEPLPGTRGAAQLQAENSQNQGPYAAPDDAQQGP